MSQIPADFPEIDWTVPADPHESAQLRALAQLPLWEKLEGLESAQIIAQSLEKSRLQQAREKNGAPENLIRKP